MSTETVESPAARAYIAGLSPVARRAIQASLATIVDVVEQGFQAPGSRLPVHGAPGLVATVRSRDGTGLIVSVDYDMLGSEARGAEPGLTREHALAIVERGIGSRPDLPTGRQFTRRVRGVWKGLSSLGRLHT